MAAAPESSGARTGSRCTIEMARGTHAFDITGYSLLKDLGSDYFIRSKPFVVGSQVWCIRFYPNTSYASKAGFVSIYLEPMASHNAMVQARCSLSLVDQTTRKLLILFIAETTKFVPWNSESWGHFMKKRTLEASPYLKNDCLVIECSATVIKKQVVWDTEATSHLKIKVPHSDLSENLGKLLELEEGADVTFNVSGEVFHAHKMVLAVRSPVFRAQLTGAVGESNRQCIVIEDIQPTIFKALLHFIYTDSLPAVDGLGDEDEKEEMVKHLLVAADKYAMERMKLICESILGERLDTESVASTLALADQYHCSQLKDACMGFINSLDRMNHVAASQGYERLKRACPTIIVDLWEKAAKSCKI